MSTPFIHTPEQIAALRTEAESWGTTPYVPAGCIKGSGCSCQNLPSAVLRAVGFDHPAPPDRGAMPKAQILPAMLTWLEAHPTLFARVTPEEIAPGDVLVWRVGTGHLSLALDRGEILHIWQHECARIVTRTGLSESRLIAVFRPLST